EQHTEFAARRSNIHGCWHERGTISQDSQQSTVDSQQSESTVASRQLPVTVDGDPRLFDWRLRLSTVDCGLWTVDCGLWTVDCGLWTVDCGLWTVDCRLIRNVLEARGSVRARRRHDRCEDG